MHMTTLDFVEWIEKELDDRDWSRADLSKHGKITAPQVTRILNREQNPGIEFCRAISVAFKIPLEQVFRRATILPANPEINEEIETMVSEASKLPKDDQREVLAFIRMKNNLRKK